MSQEQATLPFEPIVKHNFEQFLGHQKLIEVLRQPDDLPQFTYIQGECSTGKSHVINALHAQLVHNHVTMVLDANQLQEVDVTAILPGGLEFLLIDDADHLAGNADAELALFNLFNHCKSHGIKLVITAAIHAKNSAWQLPDLISRLSSGLHLRLEPLKGDQALTCFQLQFKMNGMVLDDAVMQYIKTHHNTSYPNLFQLFQDVAIESLKFKRKVTVPLIKLVSQKRAAQESEA